MDPGTAMLIATAIATAAKGTSDYMTNRSQNKAASRRAKEVKRETQGGLYNEAFNRSADLEAHGLKSRKKVGQRRAQSMNDTSELIRGAFNI